MKHLPKSLRSRRRYVFFETETFPDASVTERGFRRQIWFETQNLLGDVGSSLNDVSLVEFEHEDGVGHGVLRCSHDRVDETRAALACVDEVGGESVGVRVVGVSGTLESGREKHVREPESAEVARVGGSKAYRRGDELDVEVDDHEDTNFIGATTHDTQ